MKMSRLTIAITAALLGAAVFSSGAFAAKGVPGKPGGEETTAAQNLSVPTIMVGTPAGGLNCGSTALTPTALVPPPGAVTTPDPLYYAVPNQTDLYWWVQKVHKWQAQCLMANAAEAFGAWGDNLGGDAKLKVNKPIRVELVLDNATEYTTEELPATLQGYKVIKLEPDKLDRLSAYGHPARDDGAGGWAAVPIEFPQLTSGTPETPDFQQGWLVHDSQIKFRVCALDTNGDETSVCPVKSNTTPTAEINATGKVVYGYQLYVAATGTYRITFTTSANVTLTGQDSASGGLDDDHNVYIDIKVGTGGGGGGGKVKPTK